MWQVKIPEGTIEALFADPAGELADLLKYHVANGTIMSGDMSDEQMIPTLLGRDVMITINEEGIFVNDAKVTTSDIEADNGVVHVIDAVLLPEMPTGIPDKSAAARILGIHPNPASDYVHLSGLNGLKEGRIRLISLTGMVVRDTYIPDLSEPIDISSLYKGAYFLILDSPDVRFSGKLMVK